jgi:hypothetical protein
MNRLLAVTLIDQHGSADVRHRETAQRRTAAGIETLHGTDQAKRTSGKEFIKWSAGSPAFPIGHQTHQANVLAHKGIAPVHTGSSIAASAETPQQSGVGLWQRGSAGRAAWCKLLQPGAGGRGHRCCCGMALESGLGSPEGAVFTINAPLNPSLPC